MVVDICLAKVVTGSCHPEEDEYPDEYNRPNEDVASRWQLSILPVKLSMLNLTSGTSFRMPSRKPSGHSPAAEEVSQIIVSLVCHIVMFSFQISDFVELCGPFMLCPRCRSTFQIGHTDKN